MSNKLKSGDALIVVDVQNDFCEGGDLEIKDSNEIIPVLNELMREAAEVGVPIYVSRCWHPKGHISFKAQGGKWEEHCLQDSSGAKFHPDLEIPEQAVIVSKGTRFDQDQSSAFDETGLAQELRRRDVKRVLIGGLAEDICVASTALDGRNEDFKVVLLTDATRPTDLERCERAHSTMEIAGVEFESSSDL
ncbi:nicotinamidase/pyrazinamidase [Pseudidiomarina planktonica]|uniref:nicotinamidase n=1 Tax=Pseudidiomarina planktonica TaxID=1323738 RepID=A0A1Y6FVY7_9GAMM|nr:isochorismatase family protein [Pseudidiomarina planktonica]RUO64024.1 nicotinamidase [Pseudidiomarina planktonica]SMQ79878.1 nicotinamidase/pyrazinamidase [Pseudidiomarina planktonica]